MISGSHGFWDNETKGEEKKRNMKKKGHNTHTTTNHFSSDEALPTYRWALLKSLH